jgi:PAS domain S-box-containing protein
MEHNSENKMEKNVLTHIRINTDEVYDFVEDKSVLDILEFIKQAYPFTFIGRQKFKRKIEQLDFEFWIKDADGKIVIVNELFAKSLGVKVSEIEGKSISNIYNKEELELIKNITSYILATSNSVIYETFSKKNKKEFFQTVEFPICDIDDNVVAIIGFKQKAFNPEEIVKGKDFSKFENIKNIPAIIVRVTKDFIIKDFSDKFYEEFHLNSDTIKDQNLGTIFTINFPQLLLKTSGSIIRIGKNEYRFEYVKVNNELEKGYYFAFNKLVKDHSSDDKIFSMLMHASPDPMFIYSIDDLRFLKVNNAALKFYGYSEEEFLLMDLTDLYAPEDIQTLLASSSRNTIEFGFTGPWRQKKKDGSTVEVEISKFGIEFNGKQTHFNIIRDASKNIRNNKVIYQYDAVFNNTSDVIITTDADGFINGANKTIGNQFGYDVEELKEQSFLSLLVDDYRAKVNTTVFHCAVPKKTELECEIKNKNGSTKKANLVAIPVTGANNEVESFIIIIKVKQEIVKTVVEKEFIEVPSETSGATGTLDSEFLSHLFHELLTPVNVIIGFSQELIENVGDVDSDSKEAAEIIKENQKTLLQLMNNAVQYVELEQNKSELQPKELRFVDLIDQIENDIKKIAVNLNKEFSYGKISSSLQFETDEAKLLSLITLLLEFAMRVTKNEKVYLSAYQEDTGHCVVTVKDDRNHISKELINGLEEIFNGDENDVRHKYGISRFMRRFALKVTELLADNKGVINKLGEPSEYGFTFPMKFNHIKAEKILKGTNSQHIVAKKTSLSKTSFITGKKKDEEQINRVSQAEAPVDSSDNHEPITVQVNVTTQSNVQQDTPAIQESTAQAVAVKPKVQEAEAVVVEPVQAEKKEVKFGNLSCLYVEDQIDSQILFKVQMKELKSIEFVNSFEKALPLLRSKKYDFVVLDINLQGEYNGLDALRVIQKMPEYQTVPIIAVTAYVLPGDRERFISAGFTDFISKPILRDKLESVLNNIFGD